jgi:DNA-binding PadR family transcriptional regulator
MMTKIDMADTQNKLTLYPLLRRLESQGLLQSEWNVEGSRPRRYYVISPDGTQVLESLTKDWRELTETIEKILRA